MYSHTKLHLSNLCKLSTEHTTYTAEEWFRKPVVQASRQRVSCQASFRREGGEEETWGEGDGGNVSGGRCGRGWGGRPTERPKDQTTGRADVSLDHRFTPLMHTSYPPLLSTPPIHTSYPYLLSTRTIHTSYSHLLSTPPIHTSYPHLLSTPSITLPIHTSYPHLLSTPPIHTSYPHILCTPPIHASYPHLPSTLPIHTSYPHLLSSPPIHTSYLHLPYPHLLSTPLIHTSYPQVFYQTKLIQQTKAK